MLFKTRDASTKQSKVAYASASNFFDAGLSCSASASRLKTLSTLSRRLWKSHLAITDKIHLGFDRSLVNGPCESSYRSLLEFLNFQVISHHNGIKKGIIYEN